MRNQHTVEELIKIVEINYLDFLLIFVDHKECYPLNTSKSIFTHVQAYSWISTTTSLKR